MDRGDINMTELPMLIKRCLAFGIAISPYMLHRVLSRYEMNKIPYDVLANLSKEDVAKYVRALYLSSCEFAIDWSKGHDMLMELGFTKVERKEAHRTFISLEYNQEIK